MVTRHLITRKEFSNTVESVVRGGDNPVRRLVRRRRDGFVDDSTI